MYRKILISLTLVAILSLSLPLQVFAVPGAYQHFEHGTIYSSDLGTYAVLDPLDDKYWSLGAMSSQYGFPVGETYSVGSSLCQSFEGGTLCDPSLSDPFSNGKIEQAIQEIQTILDKSYPLSTDYWRYVWLREDRDRVADILTSSDGRTSYVTTIEIRSLMNWQINKQGEYRDRLKSNQDKRWLFNSMYIRNLRTLKNLNVITDLEAFAAGADFISKYWDDSQVGRDNFERDFAVVFSNRDGRDCVFSSEGCFGNLTDKQRAFYVGDFGGTGFNTIFDDNKYDARSNVPFHITGLGINFSYAGDSLCGPSSRDPLYLPVYLCMKVEEWAIFHETWQQHRMGLSLTGENGSSWEDLFSSLVGIGLGRDLRNGSISVSDFGNEIRYRFGTKIYNPCDDLIPLVPAGIYWNRLECEQLPEYFLL